MILFVEWYYWQEFQTFSSLKKFHRNQEKENEKRRWKFWTFELLGKKNFVLQETPIFTDFINVIFYFLRNVKCY